MIIIDLLIIFGVLFVSIFLVELLLTKLFNVVRKDERYVNEIHKKLNIISIIVLALILIVLIIFKFLGFKTGLGLVFVILFFPVLSSLIDLFIFVKYEKASKQYILSIAHIVLYSLFLIALFTTDLFGLVD